MTKISSKKMITINSVANASTKPGQMTVDRCSRRLIAAHAESSSVAGGGDGARQKADFAAQRVGYFVAGLGRLVDQALQMIVHGAQMRADCFIIAARCIAAGSKFFQNRFHFDLGLCQAAHHLLFGAHCGQSGFRSCW